MEGNPGATPWAAQSAGIAPTPVTIREMYGRRDANAFVRFPWRVYADDPQWVPPLLVERKAFIDPHRHPFYQHGAAAKLLAWRRGEVVGRILVSDDPRYNAQHGANAGCFGMFESIDDRQVAHALLEAAAAWLRGRGRTQILGPIDYSTNYGCGLLVEGFDTPPRVLMNHNPPYYAPLLESWGLAKAKDLYSWWFDDSFDMLQVWRERAEHLARRGRVRVRSFRVDDLQNEVRRCKAVYNQAWRQNWGFVQMTDAEFDYLVGDLVRLARPELLVLAEVDDRTVGFSMTLPDFNEAIRPLRGRLTHWGLPLGWLRFRRNCHSIKTARMLTLGVIDGYRRRGIAELLILHTLDYGKNTAGFTGAELGWTLEDNESINRTIRAVGGWRYKTYRIYEKAIVQGWMPIDSSMKQCPLG